MEKITLSPSKMNVLRECPRCFYNENVRGIKRPRGIFPSLPGGMDITMKKYFDQHRGSMPEFLKGTIPGTLYSDLATLKRWRFWRTAPRFIDAGLNVEIYMAIDDLAVYPDGEFVPLDVKTKGSKPKDDGSQYYQLQMDVYNLGFKNSGHKVKELAHLLYFYPLEASNFDDKSQMMPIYFGVDAYVLQCSCDRAFETIKKACEIIRGPMPDADPGCEYCNFTNQRRGEV